MVIKDRHQGIRDFSRITLVPFIQHIDFFTNHSCEYLPWENMCKIIYAISPMLVNSREFSLYYKDLLETLFA